MNTEGPATQPPPHVDFVVYDGMTALDFVGAFDPITRLRTMDFVGLAWTVHEPPGTGSTAEVTATAGLRVGVDERGADLAGDVLVVPGGVETRHLRDDDRFVEWLADGSHDLVASVCTGSLLLGAAGYLDGRRATTHPGAFDELGQYCEVVRDRLVDDGDVVTAGGVTSALDLGLHVVERLTDTETREAIATQMDYPHFNRAD